MEYRPVVPTGMMPTGLQDYHATIPDLSPPRSQGSSTGGASSIGEYAPRMYTPPTPPTPHDDDKVKENIPFVSRLSRGTTSFTRFYCISWKLKKISNTLRGSCWNTLYNLGFVVAIFPFVSGEGFSEGQRSNRCYMNRFLAGENRSKIYLRQDYIFNNLATPY